MKQAINRFNIEKNDEIFGGLKNESLSLHDILIF